MAKHPPKRPRGAVALRLTLPAPHPRLSLRVPLAQDHSQRLIDLEAARKAGARCVQLNPMYAPCHVWLSRALDELARRVGGAGGTSGASAARAERLRVEAQSARAAAAILSFEDDGEPLGFEN